MRAVRSLLSWLGVLAGRERVERELDAELQFHLEQEMAERIAAGDSPGDARAAALRSLGSVAHTKDGCRDSLGLRVADALRQDLRQTARTLLREPGFALVVIGSLALGIGANTAIFQLINAVRLRALPVANPEEIVSVQVRGGHQGLGLSSGFNSDLTFALWERIREHQTAFSGVFAWGNAQFLLGSGADAEVIEGLWVSGELFQVLQLSPARGRLLTTTDDQNGCGTGGAVLSYAYWRRHFGGDEAVVGKSLSLIGHPVRVVGVAPKGFFGLEVGKSFDIALPVCAEATWGTSAGRRDVWWLTVMGRLKPDWTVARAFEHLQALSPGIFEATVPPGYSRVVDDQYKRLRLTATAAGNGSSRLRESYDTPLLLLLAMTGMVLLVACVNLANLLLARGTARQREIAVRLAVGASNRRMVFQFLTEGLVLSILGCALGLGLSSALSRGLVALLDSEVEPILIDVSLDWRVLAFSAGVAVSTCLVFALIPALRSLRGQPLAAIKDGGRGATRGRDSFSIHRVLVASQIALSLILLSGALLFVRSFRNLTTLDAGFRRHGIIFAGFLPGISLPPDQRGVYQQRLLEEIQSTAGVSGAALTSYIPLANASWTLGVHVPNSQGEEVGDSKFTYVSPGYFATMEVPLVSGRDFNTDDRSDSARVAIVNQAFVRRYIRATSPIGARVRTVAEPGNPSTVYDVVGVVRDTKYGNLREGTPAMAFVPSTQNPDRRPSGVVAIHTSVDPDALIGDLRRRLRASHPDMTVRFRVFERQIQEGLSRERLMAWLAGFFGAVATTLVVIGLYGLLSYVVQRRTNEIGIRVALGATRSSISALVLRQTIWLVAAGLAIGVPVSLVAGRSAGSLLFGLTPTDAPTIIAAAGLLTAVAVCASLAPARRAARVDPIRALREE